MPKAVVLKPTIYFRNRHWRVREPMPRQGCDLELTERWISAHDYCQQLNRQLALKRV